MKRILAIFAMAVALLGSTSLQASAELSKQETKAIEKDVKKRAKELRKAKWEPLAATATMEYSLTKYRTYIESDDNRIALTGIAVGRNPKIGRENAILAAIANYAQRAKSQIVGKAKEVLASDNNGITVEEIDKYGAAYEAGVNTKIGALVKEHFALVRTLPNGTKEFNVFLSLDETAAKKAREEANKLAKEQTQLQTLSEMADEFIGEPVEPDYE